MKINTNIHFIEPQELLDKVNEIIDSTRNTILSRERVIFTKDNGSKIELDRYSFGDVDWNNVEAIDILIEESLLTDNPVKTVVILVSKAESQSLLSNYLRETISKKIFSDLPTYKEAENISDFIVRCER